MKYNKLIRDKIPDHIRAKGGTPVFHVADEVEYWTKLKEKVLEEFEEFKADESVEEFADLMEVLMAIAEYKNFDPETVEKVRAEKVAKRGAFKERLILDES